MTNCYLAEEELLFTLNIKGNKSMKNQSVFTLVKKDIEDIEKKIANSLPALNGVESVKIKSVKRFFNNKFIDESLISTGKNGEHWIIEILCNIEYKIEENL